MRWPCSNGCEYWSASETELLPYLLSTIDRSIIKQLADAPTIPTDAEQATIDREIANIDSKLTGIKAKINRASVDATLALADTITDLTDRRTQLQQQRRATSHVDRVQAAYDRWEALVQPYLIPITTDTAPPLAHQLGIEGEYNRLFNTIHAKPSAVRAMLQSLDTRGKCGSPNNPPGSDLRACGRHGGWIGHASWLPSPSVTVATVPYRAGELCRSAAGLTHYFRRGFLGGPRAGSRRPRRPSAA